MRLRTLLIALLLAASPAWSATPAALNSFPNETAPPADTEYIIELPGTGAGRTRNITQQAIDTRNDGRYTPAAHQANTDNPHQTTAEQVGADPAGTAAQAIIDHEQAADPHGQYLLQSEVGLEPLQVPRLDDAGNLPSSTLPPGYGADGKSAYEVAVDAGFVGTQEEWLLSLQGDPGPEGAEGPAGPQGDPGLGITEAGDGDRLIDVTNSVDPLCDADSVGIQFNTILGEWRYCDGTGWASVSGGGHVILDTAGEPLEQKSQLYIVGPGVEVFNAPVEDRTVVMIEGVPDASLQENGEVLQTWTGSAVWGPGDGITIGYAPTEYTPQSADLGGHLQALGARLAELVATIENFGIDVRGPTLLRVSPVSAILDILTDSLALDYTATDPSNVASVVWSLNGGSATPLSANVDQYTGTITGFTPNVENTVTVTATDDTNPGNTTTETLTVTYKTSVADIDPQSKDFGNVAVDTTATQLFTVSNSGLADLIPGTASISGAGAAKYSILDDSCDLVDVATLGTCTVLV